MNIDNGHVLSIPDLKEAESLRVLRGRYEVVPPHLYGEAAAAMGGAVGGWVNMRKRSPLTAWAKKKRKERKKAEKAARKAQRRQ